MSNLAYSMHAELANAASEPTAQAAASSTPPDRKTQALLAQEKNSMQPMDASDASDASVLARAAQPKVERRSQSQGTIGSIALAGSQESGWVTLQTDASTTGLHTQGRWQADVEIATNLSRMLLAQILPTQLDRRAHGFEENSARAVVCENLWIDIFLHQIESKHTSLCPLSMLELAVYRVINGNVKLVKSVKSSPMPMEMLSIFTLGYRLKRAKITVDICSEIDRLTTTHIDMDGFGETLPVVKLRSGRALPDGIFRAKYRQIVSWSA